MNRIVCIVLLLILTLSLFVSCKPEESSEPEVPREYVESEVLSQATALLANCGEINRILWGVGIPISQSEDAVKSGNYTEADPEWAEMMNVHSVIDLKAMCREIYSDEVFQMAERTIFSPVKDSEDNVIALVRYYDYTPENKAYLMVNTKGTVYFERDVEYLSETLSIKEVKGQKIYLTVDVLVYNENNQAQTRTLTFSVIEEESGWRLSTPTYMTYISE